VFVFKVADEKLLAHLILVMLERSSLLLNIPTYSKEIHRYARVMCILGKAARFQYKQGFPCRR